MSVTPKYQAPGKTGKKRVTVADLIERRRDRWEHGGPHGGAHDEGYDRMLREDAAERILSDEGLRDEVLARPWLLIELCFTIVDKNNRLVPFFLNDVQRDFIGQLDEHGGGRPYFILKGRQQGLTSLITAVQTCYVIVRKHFSGFTLSHRADSTRMIFNDKARAGYERLPARLHQSQQYSNAQEMVFDKMDSRWRCSTAVEGVARGATLNFIHYSEVAFYDVPLSVLQESIGQAATADAIVIYETTANGYNEAKSLWDSGTCINLFYEWWRSAEYTRPGDEFRGKADAWLRERLQVLSERGLTEEQLEWYAWKYDGYLNKDSIKQEYPCFPEEAFVFSGSPVFDAEAVANQLQRAEMLRPRIGQFTYRRVGVPLSDREGVLADVEWTLADAAFVERPDGMIRIHEEPRKKKGMDGVELLCPYVIGGDTAGSGQDYSTAKVVDAITGRTAATLRVQYVDEDEYAEQLLCLAQYYNAALIAVEVNFSPAPMRVIKAKYGYANLYFREVMSKVADEMTREPGFRTTAQTKSIIISELVADMREDPGAEVDPDTLREMMTFQRVVTPSGYTKMEAASGAHDDLVMALAIAHHALGQSTRAWFDTDDKRGLPDVGDPFGWAVTPGEEEQEEYGDGEGSAFLSWEDM